MLQKKANTNPIFYVQASSLTNFPNVIMNNFPLWIACYSQESRMYRYAQVVKSARFIQLTSHPFDIDIFKGNPSDMVNIIKGV